MQARLATDPSAAHFEMRHSLLSDWHILIHHPGFAIAAQGDQHLWHDVAAKTNDSLRHCGLALQAFIRASSPKSD